LTVPHILTLASFPPRGDGNGVPSLHRIEMAAQPLGIAHPNDGGGRFNLGGAISPVAFAPISSSERSSRSDSTLKSQRFSGGPATFGGNNAANASNVETLESGLPEPIAHKVLL
jgi:hypothetical protein